MSGGKSISRVKLGIIISFSLLSVALFSCALLFLIAFSNVNSDEMYTFQEENYVSVSLVSPFGTNEYRCTGTCACETTTGREYPASTHQRRAGILKHSTFYLVSAISSVVAYQLFQNYLSEECFEQFEAADCPIHAIESFVDDCEDFLFTESSSSSLEKQSSDKKGAKKHPKLVIDPFCERQFGDDYDGTKVPMGKEEFLQELIEIIEDNDLDLKDGYAPFCKHFFVPNFANCDAGYIKIDEETESLIETKYHSRREDELPVLVRFIRKENLKEVPKGKYLDIILYSREQIELENEAMGHQDDDVKEEEEDYDYGIISVNCIFQDCEVPMNPITCMRNALGKEYGGSGKELSKEDYQKSVDFWKDNVSIGD